MNIKNILLDIVDELNYEISILLENTEIKHSCYLTYHDTGNVFCVNFLDINLFDNQYDSYEDDEGNLIINKEYFKNKILNIIINLNKVNFK